MKLTKKWLAACLAAGSILLAAIAINARASAREIVAEITWKLSAVTTFFLGSITQGAQDGMRYLNENSMGVSALCAIIGLAFSIYFQWKSSKKKQDDEE